MSAAVGSGWVSQGRLTQEFETQLAALLGVPHVVVTTSGSVALYLTVLSLGLGPGDEVLVPNRTWIASAHAPVLAGARAVLVDVTPGRPVIDPQEAARRVTSRTKAILAVPMGGRACDLEALRALATERGLALWEDAAQALLSRDPQGRLLGTQTLAGCFSLSMAKLLSTGQGGFVATGDGQLAEQLRRWRNHGLADPFNPDYAAPGGNFKFTDLQAALGLSQLAELEGRTQRLRDLYRQYREGLAGLDTVRLVEVRVEAGELPLYIEALTPWRAQLVEFLEQRSIQARPFYPDLDRAAYLGSSGDYPHSREFGEQGVYLPSGPDQRPADIERVLAEVRAFRPVGSLRG